MTTSDSIRGHEFGCSVPNISHRAAKAPGLESGQNVFLRKSMHRIHGVLC